MMANSELSEMKRWLEGLVQAGEAAVTAAENCPGMDNPQSELALFVTSQRDVVRGEVVRFRAKLATLGPAARPVEKKFGVTFDQRYWKPGTFVYPLQVFLDPEHNFTAQQVRQIQTLEIGQTVDLGDGRTVQRQQ
ncbi:hypothetical protein [Paraburkholderia sp. BCC1885]|uniref:hypothetical protein n=1 Tax=Paraburkholderia sp. BCC1885 TaxID=2562669 RepID=UPI0011843A7C|nr:hypothetical protein [Paraburkholderia sp. BCC1885]